MSERDPTTSLVMRGGTHRRTEPWVGAVLAGRYKIESMIARGGMGAVYLASQVQLNRPVALKLLRPRHHDEEELESFQKRFKLEAETLASLKHPNIVTIYDYGQTDDGEFYLAMEYIDGQRMADLLRGELPSPPEVTRIVMSICAALRYAHRRGVVHRDIKLSNILIEEDEFGEKRVKVVDFGLAKIMEVDQNLTAVGTVMGSPHFMAPEQVRGLPIDHRADIYAVGVLLYCSLAGKYPFHGADRTSTMRAHLEHPAPPFSESAPDREIPPGLERVTMRCLEKSPDRRYQDMAELMKDLGGVMGLDPGSSVTFAASGEDSLQIPGAVPTRRLWGWAAALMALGFLVVVGLVASLSAWYAISQAHLSEREPAEAASVPSGLPPDADPGSTDEPQGVEGTAAATSPGASPGAAETPSEGGSAAATTRPTADSAQPPPGSAGRVGENDEPAATTTPDTPSEHTQPQTSQPGSTVPATSTEPSSGAGDKPDGWEPVSDVRDPWSK